MSSAPKYTALVAILLLVGVLCPQPALSAGEKDRPARSADQETSTTGEQDKDKDSGKAKENENPEAAAAGNQDSGAPKEAAGLKSAARSNGRGPKFMQRGRSVASTTAAAAATSGKIFGFQDKDRDGRNDLFRDANGDGVNDVDNKPYPHRFGFVDQNKDGINDKFVDEDGDGVNDLNPEFVDEDGDGVCDNVIDFSGKFINDITGMRYNTKSLRGYKFGFINEERREMMRNFIDENADGIPDMPGRFGQMGPPPGGMGPPGRDWFIDRDGDGIDDRRQRMEQLRKGQKQ